VNAICDTKDVKCMAIDYYIPELTSYEPKYLFLMQFGLIAFLILLASITAVLYYHVKFKNSSDNAIIAINKESKIALWIMSILVAICLVDVSYCYGKAYKSDKMLCDEILATWHRFGAPMRRAQVKIRNAKNFNADEIEKCLNQTNLFAAYSTNSILNSFKNDVTFFLQAKIYTEEISFEEQKERLLEWKQREEYKAEQIFEKVKD